MTESGVTATASRIATSLGLSESELSRQALISFFARAETPGIAAWLEHSYSLWRGFPGDKDLPGGRRSASWREDLIVAENLTARLEELDAYLDRLQGAAADIAE